MKLSSFLQTLQLNSGDHYRGDCPVCGVGNTFSATNEFGNIQYYCFRASCPVSGAIQKEMSYEDVVNSFTSRDANTSDHVRRVYDIPDHFVGVGERKEVIEYLRKNHCLSAYYDKRADIRYDPRQNRVVFLIKEGDVCYDAVGRSLDRNTTPKWFRYGGNSGFFLCCSTPYDYRRLVLVEDCASACAVSCLFDGCALLGTQLGLANISSLIKYDTIYVALDKDASDKSFDIQRYLSFYCKDVKVVLLERDLKYLEKNEIENAFK